MFPAVDLALDVLSRILNSVWAQPEREGGRQRGAPSRRKRGLF